MTALRAALADVAEALDAEDRPAYDYVPEDIGAPAVIVQPGEDYVADGQAFGEHRLNAEVVVCVDLQSNAQAAIDLDDGVQHVLDNLPDDWAVTSMTRPGPMGTTDWTVHGLTIRIARLITLH